MKLAVTVLAIYLSLAAALPAHVEERQDYVPCTDPDRTAKCCALASDVSSYECVDRTSR
jgi:hypothetical protein